MGLKICAGAFFPTYIFLNKSLSLRQSLARTFKRISQMVAYDQDLAEAFGINNKDDFKKFYTILHDLYLSGGQCNANNVNQDDAAQYDQYNQDGNYNQYNQDGNYDQDGNYNQDAEDQDAEAENEAEDNEGEQEGEQEGQEDGGEGQRLRRRLQDDEENQDAQDQDAQDQDLSLIHI